MMGLKLRENLKLLAGLDSEPLENRMNPKMTEIVIVMAGIVMVGIDFVEVIDREHCKN